jgi:hypothetical protein
MNRQGDIFPAEVRNAVYLTEADRIQQEMYRIGRRTFERKVKLVSLLSDMVVIAPSHVLESPLTAQIFFETPELLTKGIFVPSLPTKFDSFAEFLREKRAEFSYSFDYSKKGLDKLADFLAVYTCSGCRLNPLVKIGVDSIGGIHILGAIYSHGIMGYYGKYFYKMPSGTWSELSPWTSGEVFEYDLALDNDNRVHVVWRAYVNYHYHILYTSYQLGIWQIPTQLSSNYSDTNLDPDVIITPCDNEVHAMWSEYPGKLHYAHRTPTGVWSTPILVAGDSGFFVPKMAIDSEHHALWVASRRNYADIYVIVKTQTDWLSPVVLFRRSPVGYYEETPQRLWSMASEKHILCGKTRSARYFLHRSGL